LLPLLPRAFDAGTQVYPVVSSSLEHTDVAFPVKEDGNGENAVALVAIERRLKKTKYFILIDNITEFKIIEGLLVLIFLVMMRRVTKNKVLDDDASYSK
jgi:hypothetical protein